MQNLAGDNESHIIRYAALLRGTESAWQALSYGLESLTVFAEHGGVYMNFGLWAISLAPAWLVVRHFGIDHDDLAEETPTSSPAEPESTEYKQEQLK